MRDLLATLLAGLLAAEAAFLANRALFAALARRAPGAGRVSAPRSRALVAGAVPVVEEAAKDLAALLLQADLWGAHLVFGLVEAVFEGVAGEGRGWFTGVLGFCGHALFGAATWAALERTGSVWLAAAAGIGLHVTWNAAAFRLGRRERTGADGKDG